MLTDCYNNKEDYVNIDNTKQLTLQYSWEDERHCHARCQEEPKCSHFRYRKSDRKCFALWTADEEMEFTDPGFIYGGYATKEITGPKYCGDEIHSGENIFLAFIWRLGHE